MAPVLVIEQADGGARLRGRLGFDDAAAATPRWRELIRAGVAHVDVDAAKRGTQRIHAARHPWPLYQFSMSSLSTSGVFLMAPIWTK